MLCALALPAIIALTCINLAAFAAFGIDKARAAAGGRRISEAALLMLALSGGSAGAYAGRRIFRHKTRKQPFGALLHAIALLHLSMLGVAGAWIVAGGPGSASAPPMP